MQTVKIHTSQNVSIDYPVAGLGERILGRLIDLGIFVALYILMALGLLLATRSGFKSPVIFISIYTFIFCFYDLVCELFFNGQSIGKRVMKIRVISLDGSRPALGQYLLRWIFRMVDFLITFHLAGLIAVASTRNKQRIGDLVAGTTLIKTEPHAQLGSLAFTPYDESYQPVYQEVVHLTDKDIVLIHEVIASYKASRNNTLLYTMAARIRDHLGISYSDQIDNLKFLKTIIKDYNHLAVNADTV